MPPIPEPIVDHRVDAAAVLAAVLADPVQCQRFEDAMTTARNEPQRPDNLAEIRKAAAIDD